VFAEVEELNSRKKLYEGWQKTGTHSVHQYSSTVEVCATYITVYTVGVTGL